jgi:hypothetical protein
VFRSKVVFNWTLGKKTVEIILGKKPAEKILRKKKMGIKKTLKQNCCPLTKRSKCHFFKTDSFLT